MKIFLLIFLGVGCSWAGEEPISPKAALLVFTGQQLNTSATTTTTPPAPPSDKTNDSSSWSGRSVAGLEMGSASGVYHILLPDGRLQRVEYTASPTSPPSGQQDSPDASGRQAGGSPQPGPRSIYFVQVPQDRLQTLLGSPASGLPEPRAAQDSDGAMAGEGRSSDQPPSVSQDFLPVVVLSAGQLTAGPVDGRPGSADRGGKALPDPGYLASVQLTEVRPIAGPLYAYNPPALVRVLRRAVSTN